MYRTARFRFFNSERQERTRRFDVAVEGLQGDLNKPEIRQHLGSYALTVGSLLDRVYLPNVDASGKVVPKDTREDGIAVIPMIDRKPMRFSAELDMPTSRQLMNARKVFGEKFYGHPDAAGLFAVSALTNMIDTIKALPDSVGNWMPGDAATLKQQLIDTQYSNDKGSTVYRQYTRPTVVLLENNFLAKVTLAHELLHVDQFERTPIMVREEVPTQIANMELEANHMGTRHLAGLRATSEFWHNLPPLNEERIEGIRRNHNGPSDFNVSNKIISDLKGQRLDHAVWRDADRKA